MGNKSSAGSSSVVPDPRPPRPPPVSSPPRPPPVSSPPRPPSVSSPPRPPPVSSPPRPPPVSSRPSEMTSSRCDSTSSTEESDSDTSLEDKTTSSSIKSAAAAAAAGAISKETSSERKPDNFVSKTPTKKEVQENIKNLGKINPKLTQYIRRFGPYTEKIKLGRKVTSKRTLEKKIKEISTQAWHFYTANILKSSRAVESICGEIYLWNNRVLFCEKISKNVIGYFTRQLPASARYLDREFHRAEYYDEINIDNWKTDTFTSTYGRSYSDTSSSDSDEDTDDSSE